MASWPIFNVASIEGVTMIIIPMQYGRTSHWGIAVLRQGRNLIEVYDMRVHSRSFLPVFPLLRWANSIGMKYGNSGWCAKHQIEEHTNVVYPSDMAVELLSSCLLPSVLIRKK